MKHYLVLGATGAIGYAFTQELLKNHCPVTILVRDKAKAKKLFPNHPLLTIVTGDAHDASLLKKLCDGKDVVFHGINYPYSQWVEKMMDVTIKLTEAVERGNATILFPGNIYAFGNVSKPITEQTPYNAHGPKGHLRAEINNYLKKWANKSKNNVIVLRLPDFYGENVTNGLIKPVFGNAVKGKAIQWFINAKIPHQMVYTGDVAKLFYRLCQKEGLDNFFVLNYGGEIYESVEELNAIINKQTGNSKKVKVIPKWVLNLLGLFIKDVKEIRENYYQFEGSVFLDDSKLKKMYPEFIPLGKEKAIANTLEWYKQQK